MSIETLVKEFPLINDFPEQFKEKKLILGLTRAFDKQLGELLGVFQQLQTDLSLDHAEGKQLDLIGDIVGLTRAEAGLLCGDEIFFPILEDRRYRQYLKYKAYKNSNNCTYYDLIQQLQTVWGVDEIQYEEDELYPATIIVTASLLTPEGGPADISYVPSVHPAGVGFLYRYRLKYVIQVGKLLTLYGYEQPMCGAVVCGVYPTVATLGSSHENGVIVSDAHSEHTHEYDLAGTYPETATIGMTNEKAVEASSEIALDENQYGFMGDDTVMGVMPEIASLGVSASAEVDASADTELNANDYEATGTIPDKASVGTSYANEIEASSEIELEGSEYDAVGSGVIAGTAPSKASSGTQSSSSITSAETTTVIKTDYTVSGKIKCGKYF